MFVITFKVDGIPVPKARPRFTKVGNFVQTYTPKKTADWEETVRWTAKGAMGPTDLLETPLSLALYFRLPTPKSWSKKRTEACLNGFERHTKRPDLTNIIKSIEELDLFYI